MYIIRMYYVFLVHMYIAMCSDDRSGQKGLSWYSVKTQGLSWYSVEAQGPSQYTPHSSRW